MQSKTKSGVRWLLTAVALSALAGGAMAANDNSSSSGTDDAAPAATAPQNQAGARDFHRGGSGDFRRGGPGDGRADGWRHRGYHDGYRGGEIIIVRPGFGRRQSMMHRGFHRFGPRGMEGPGGPGMLDRPLLGAFRQLDLTADQRQKVRAILMNARQQATQRRPAAGTAPNFNALLDPGDPNHARAVQAAKDRAAQRIQLASQTQQSLYDVLTAEQKAKLTQTFAQMRTRMQQRAGGRGRDDRGASRDRHTQQPDGQPQDSQPGG